MCIRDSKKGATTEEVSTFVEDELMNQLEGITGVASISTGGLIESKAVSYTHLKFAALACFAVNRKPKPQQGGDLLDHRKPQPETARAVLAILTARWIFLIKTIPNPREILWSDADAVVFDRETDRLPVAARCV